MSIETPKIADRVVPRRVYVPAVGPRLKQLLYVVFGLVAVLSANALYLAAVTFLEWYSAQWGEGLTYQNYFYQAMILVHLGVGLLLIGPVIVFGTIHMWNSRNRRNRRAVRIGYALFACSLLVLATGVALMRVGGLDLKAPLARS